MPPIPRRLEILERNHAQDNQQRPGKERFPFKQDAVGLDEHAECGSEHPRRDTQSKPAGQRGEQSQL